MDIVKRLQQLQESDKDDKKIKEGITTLQNILTRVNNKEAVSYGEQREAVEDAIELIEAKTYEDLKVILRTALKGAYNDEYGPFIMDFTDSWVVFERDHEIPDKAVAGKYYKADYTLENNKPIFSNIREVYRKVDYEALTQESMVEKSIREDQPIKLIEKVGKNGDMPIKIISPGWGSSGYYSAEVLKKAAPNYKEGLKMYLDHPTKSEDKERPERSVKDLAAVTTSQAEYKEDGKNGPGLYAYAKVFEDKKDFISEKAPYIGLSHRASGKAYTGEAEGQKGAIISEINQAHSVDFVTMAGAGGQIVEMFESYNNKSESMEQNKTLEEAQKERDEAIQENKKLTERLLTREAKDFVSREIAEKKLPEVTKQRLVESLATQYKVTDKGEIDEAKFKETISEAVKEETAYISKITGSGNVTGFGESGKTETSLEESKQAWMSLGYSEDEAKFMTENR